MRIPLITKYLEEKNMEYQNALLEKQVQEVQISILPCAAGGMIITITCRQ